MTLILFAFPFIFMMLVSAGAYVVVRATKPAREIVSASDSVDMEEEMEHILHRIRQLIADDRKSVEEREASGSRLRETQGS